MQRRCARPILRLACVTAVLLSTGCPGFPDAARDRPDLQGAFNHFQQHDLEAARAAFEAVATDSSATVTRDDRVTAHVLLGLLAWRYRADWDTAVRELDAALALTDDSAGVLADISRMERERGNHVGAIDAARAALRTAESASDTVEAARTLGEAALAAAEAGSGAEPRREQDSRAGTWLREAHRVLVRLLPDNTGVTDVSRVALRVALVVGDGPAALAAWRSYYVTIVGAEEAGLLEGPRRTLESRLPEWGGGPPTAELRAALARGFAASAMFEEAALVAGGPGSREPDAVPDDPEVREILNYARFIRDVREMTDAYYRRTAVDAGDSDRYREALIERAAGLWSQLRWGGDAPPPFDPDTARAELARRFRAVINLGTTAGYFDLHYGHRVVDDSITVEQYGHEAELRFVALDGMVSNGFQSWAWDYRAQHGGWASDDAIYQVRPAYADGPLRAWRALTDSAARAEGLEEERRETQRDLERAREDPFAYLPGLRLRLRRQGLEGLLADLKARGLEGAALKARFLAAYREATLASSIVAHEGRHAIDRRLGLDLPLEEREYRAKLSEVAFAPRPRLALGGILDRNIGDSTPHGQANARIMKGLVSWMEDHAGQIRGLETDRPLLPQLDRLSDGQLRAAFRAMDLLARDSAPPEAEG